MTQPYADAWPAQLLAGRPLSSSQVSGMPHATLNCAVKMRPLLGRRRAAASPTEPPSSAPWCSSNGSRNSSIQARMQAGRAQRACMAPGLPAPPRAQTHPCDACAKGRHQQAGSCVAEAVELQPQGEEHHRLPGEAADDALQHDGLAAADRSARGRQQVEAACMGAPAASEQLHARAGGGGGTPLRTRRTWKVRMRSIQQMSARMPRCRPLSRPRTSTSPSSAAAALQLAWSRRLLLLLLPPAPPPPPPGNCRAGLRLTCWCCGWCCCAGW